MRLLAAAAVPAFLAALLTGCQSTPYGGASAMREMQEKHNAALAGIPPEGRPMSDKERDALLAAADEAQAVAPAAALASQFGGLDPTGVTQSVAANASMQSAAKIQAHMPALMADARYRAAQYCKQNPALPDCVKYREAEAELRKTYGNKLP